jgi:hypothetical protein
MNSALPSIRYRSILFGCLAAAVVAVYGRALCGPLKMCGDAPGYVELAAFLLHGTPARTIAAPGYPYYFPHGYPYLLIGLNALGLANAPGILGLNLVCLAIGLWATWWLLLRTFGLTPEAAFAIVLLTAASSVFFQFASSADPEMPFFAAECAALVCFERVGRSGRPGIPFLAGVLLCGVAISIRTAGIALIPAAIWGAARLPVTKRAIVSRRWLLLAIPALLLAGLGLWLIAGSHYVSVTTANGFARFKYAPEGYWLTAVARKLAHIGELFANQRATDFPLLFRDEFVLLGVVCLGTCGLGWWARRGRVGPVDAFVTTYFLMIAAYPFWQLRLWLPIVPFVFALAFLGLEGLFTRAAGWRSFGPWLAVGYVLAFVLLGCFYSWRFTTAGVYADVDDGIKMNLRAEPYLVLLRGPEVKPLQTTH